MRNQFNREILDHNSGSTPLVSGNCSEVPYHSSHGGESASTEIKENIVNDIQNRTPDNSDVSSKLSSNCPQKDPADNSHLGNPSSIVNNDGISDVDDRSCVTQSIENCHINSVGYGDIKLNVDCQTPCYIKDNGLNSTRVPENRGGTSHSSTLSSNNDDAVNKPTQPCTVDLDYEMNQGQDKDLTAGHISQDVFKQFADVLMEAVRRRVFSLPRKPKRESCISSHGSDAVDTNKATVCAANNLRSNVGILFSGGLDSIVLAALADR